jgi:hypothetical protein
MSTRELILLGGADGGRILLDDKTGGGAVILRPIRFQYVPVCSSMFKFGLQLDLLYVHTHTFYHT